MPSQIRAVALDYDGTLAAEGGPTPAVLDAIAETRARGLRVVLVTGRILAELRAVFPEALERFDAVVAENGAVVAVGRRERALVPAVDDALDEALTRRGIGFRRGFVIVAVASGTDDRAVVDAIGDCGLDCHVARNRGELMIMPSGVSKATGLEQALAGYGISTHNCVAVGDAENDLSMFEACELGVAVGNAVPSLKLHADLVLTEPDGTGVASLLSGSLARGEPPIRPQRRQVNLGSGEDGGWVRVAASGIDLLIVGGSGSGKSFAAGLVAEQLVALGYVLCVIDPEGDHVALGGLPRAVALGGGPVPPDPEDVVRILRQSLTSVVVDLSLVSALERDAWTRQALELLEQSRATYGVPHWLLVDEAHAPLGHADGVARSFRPAHKGHCLVTYRPSELAHAMLSDLDYLLLLGGEDGLDGETLEVVSRVAGVPIAELGARAKGLGFGHALLVRAGRPPELHRLALSNRWVRHVRHWHKYAAAQLPAGRRFYFRTARGTLVGIAGNLVEFQRLLHRCDGQTLERHARARDFSRWLRQVIGDEVLAAAFEGFEGRFAQGISRVEAQDARMAMVDAVEQRYEEIA
jgi:hydroxymethylpyrimidine pyrophosphatase-like HAD family hydrolase